MQHWDRKAPSASACFDEGGFAGFSRFSRFLSPGGLGVAAVSDGSWELVKQVIALSHLFSMAPQRFTD